MVKTKIPKSKKPRFSLEEQIANRVVSPIILNLLQPFSSDDMRRAISGDLDLAEGLKNDPEYLTQLQSIVNVFPFADRAAKKLYSDKWIKWFIEGAMKTKRNDLYIQVAYNGNGHKYIQKQIRRLVRIVFNQEPDAS